MSEDNQKVNMASTLSVNGEAVPAAEFDRDTFFKSNKKTTATYRAALAQAIGTTGTIAKVVKMAFGTAGETDDQGNPAPPSDDGNLNNVVLTKNIKAVTYPVATSVCFEAEILAGEYTGDINEVALIDEQDRTAAKMRLLTIKGIDAESGAVFRWTVEF